MKEVRVPATATAVAKWVATWAKMCADNTTALGPLTNDLARSRYDLTARQLRNIRHAATSGALRRKAVELDVELPSGYLDSPADVRVDGYERITR